MAFGRDLVKKQFKRGMIRSLRISTECSLHSVSTIEPDSKRSYALDRIDEIGMGLVMSKWIAGLGSSDVFIVHHS
jgi:hypothetical protein